MDRKVDTAPIAPYLAAFFDNVLDQVRPLLHLNRQSIPARCIKIVYFVHILVQSN